VRSDSRSGRKRWCEILEFEASKSGASGYELVLVKFVFACMRGVGFEEDIPPNR
jgi:hypothetical protein